MHCCAETWKTFKMHCSLSRSESPYKQKKKKKGKREEGVEKTRLGCQVTRKKTNSINRHGNVVMWTSEKQVNINTPFTKKTGATVRIGWCETRNLPRPEPSISMCFVSTLNMWLIIYYSGVNEFLFYLYSGCLAEIKISYLKEKDTFQGRNKCISGRKGLHWHVSLQRFILWWTNPASLRDTDSCWMPCECINPGPRF